MIDILNQAYLLLQNYLNPFNPSTIINYQIKEKGFVTLKVYDMLGKEVATLVNNTQESGRYSVELNANELPSGVYIYSLTVNDFVQNTKMTLLK
ncbi:MAG: T9SS type A sorting domain-containing protein [Ignavibacteriae bacterium]|nr:T9SS type A sorting domain-containing protein [Ignavibacteriota bacterium]